MRTFENTIFWLYFKYLIRLTRICSNFVLAGTKSERYGPCRQIEEDKPCWNWSRTRPAWTSFAALLLWLEVQDFFCSSSGLVWRKPCAVWSDKKSPLKFTRPGRLSTKGTWPAGYPAPCPACRSDFPHALAPLCICSFGLRYLSTLIRTEQYTGAAVFPTAAPFLCLGQCHPEKSAASLT